MRRWRWHCGRDAGLLHQIGRKATHSVLLLDIGQQRVKVGEHIVDLGAGGEASRDRLTAERLAALGNGQLG